MGNTETLDRFPKSTSTREILPEIFKKEKNATLDLSNGEKLKVKFLGEDYYGAVGSNPIHADIYSFESLRWLADQINHFRRNHYDQVVLITGDERSGKSSLAFHLADMIDPNWSLNNVAFTEDQARDIASRLHDGDLMMMDEAGVAMYAYEWNKRGQRELAKMFQVFGIKEFCFIITLPHKQFLNHALRNSRTDWWLHVKTYGVRRGWVQLRHAIHDKWKNRVYWEEVFTIRFPKYKGEKWDKYIEKYKKPFIEKQIHGEFIAAEDEKPKDYVNRMHKAISQMNEEGHNTKAIAKMFGYTTDHISRILRQEQEKENNVAKK